MHWFSKLSLAFCLVIGAGVMGADGKQKARIVIPPEVVVAADQVRLGDIAVLEGAEAETVADLRLGTAPLAGESRTLDGRLIVAALRNAGVNLEQVAYTVPASLRVRRAAQEVSEPVVRQLIEEYLGTTLTGGEAEPVLRSVELSGPIRIPAGAYTARVIPPAGTPLLGRVRLQVEFTMSDRPVRTAWVVCDIGMFGPVVVTRRTVARGEKLAADDVTVERRDLSQLAHDVVSDPHAVAELTTRLPLAPYTAVRREALETPAVVHRGDVVLLVAEHGGIRVTAPGEAREDAGVGAQVRVVNRNSRKDITGRVVDANTVEVLF